MEKIKLKKLFALVFLAAVFLLPEVVSAQFYRDFAVVGLFENVNSAITSQNIAQIDKALTQVDDALTKTLAYLHTWEGKIVEKYLADIETDMSTYYEWRRQLLTAKLELVPEEQRPAILADIEKATKDKSDWLNKGHQTRKGYYNSRPAPSTCSFSNLGACITSIVQDVGEFFKQILIVALRLVSLLFDKSIDYSVTQFNLIGSSTPVRAGWVALRDLANLFFIFILLYAAFGMILRLKDVNGRRILATVIIIALLINFSAFFAGFVIDASNVAAQQFYNSIRSDQVVRIDGSNVGGIAATFYNALPITEALTAPAGDTIINSIAMSFGTVIMLIVTIFVFLTATILFMVRVVVLVFVIILSPMAFLAIAFPNQKSWFDKWLSALISQAIFAPLYLILVWVTINFLTATPKPWADINKGVGSSPVLIGLNFAIAIGFMLGALIIAKNLGARGAGGATKIGKKLAAFGAGAVVGGGVGWLGRRTLGWAGRAFAESEWMARQAAKGGVSGWVGKIGLSATEKVAKSSFDVRASKTAKDAGITSALGGKAQKGGYAGAIERQKKEEDKTLKKIEDKLGKEAADQYAETLLELPGAGQRARTVVGATAGAAVGTAIAPGIGTVVGAGVGAVAAGVWRWRRNEKARNTRLANEYTQKAEVARDSGNIEDAIAYNNQAQRARRKASLATVKTPTAPAYLRDLHESRTGMKEKALTAEIAEIENGVAAGEYGNNVRMIEQEIKKTEEIKRAKEKEVEETGGGRSLVLQELEQKLEGKRRDLERENNILKARQEVATKEKRRQREVLQRTKSSRDKQEETNKQRKELRDMMKELAEEDKEPKGGQNKEEK